MSVFPGERRRVDARRMSDRVFDGLTYASVLYREVESIGSPSWPVRTPTEVEGGRDRTGAHPR